jgi:hypothetical protein
MLFSPTQIHYIANPIFIAGVADPLAGIGRWHWVPGVFAERATIVPPKAATITPCGGTQARVGGSFAARLLRIGDPIEGFHKPITAAIGAAVRAGLSRADTIAALRRVILAADPGGRTPAEIGRYSSDRYLGDAFTQFARKDETQRRLVAGTEFRPEPSARAIARTKRHSQDLADYVVLKRAMAVGGAS